MGNGSAQQYSDEFLEERLKDLECDFVERKAFWKGDVSQTARQAICAFANDLPAHGSVGFLFLGAHDKDGSPSGLQVTDELLRTIADIKTDGRILPLPSLVVERRVLSGAEMVVVLVYPSDMPPVRFDGRIWVRTGPRRSLATEQEERILIEKRRHKQLPFDLHPVYQAKLKDLNRLRFEEDYLPTAYAADVLAANGRTYEEQLSSCRMIVGVEDTTPTFLGMLTLGKNPQEFIPGAYIQFLRIDGTELADMVIDEKKMGGPLASMLNSLEEKLAAHNRVKIDIISGPTDKKTWDYPLPALEQIVYNAVLHRVYEGTNTPVRVIWFDDRIEITSPGGPYGSVNIKNFGNPGITDYRNPNLATVMKNYGFVQQFGRGLATAKRELAHNGNPPLHFDVDQSQVRVTIWKWV